MNEIKGMANDLDSLLENTQTSVESEIQRLEQASNKFPAALGREVSKATSKATQTAAQVEERVRGSIEDIKKEMAGRVVELKSFMEGKSGSLENLIQTVQNDITTARTQTAQEINDGLSGAEQKQLVLEEELKKVSTQTESVRAMAVQQKNDMSTKLGDVARMLQEKLAQSAPKLSLTQS